MLTFPAEMKLFGYTGLPFSAEEYLVLYPWTWPSVCNEPCQGRVQVRRGLHQIARVQAQFLPLPDPYLDTVLLVPQLLFPNQHETGWLMNCA